MTKLERLREEVNQAYSAAVDCRCYLKKKQLLKQFYHKNKAYNRHKDWVLLVANQGVLND